MANKNSNMNINLYEINRSLIAQAGEMNFKENEEAEILVNKFIHNTRNSYYLLYGKEISYFTLFTADKFLNEMPFEAVFDCLGSVGTIYSVSLTKTKDAVEIWVKTVKDGLVTCLYLLPYDLGIVPMGV